jgi:hypothetical protein
MQDLRITAEPPQRLLLRTSSPRESQRAADKAEQHSDEEPAKV